MPVFPFVQFEFTQSVGPPAGRYTVRRDDAESDPSSYRSREPEPAEEDEDELEPLSASIGSADVVVFQVRGAPPAKPRKFRTSAGIAPTAEGDTHTEVSLTVATAILATSMMPSDMAGGRWMSSIRRAQEGQQELVHRALKLVQQCVAAYRSAAADPYVADLVLADSRVTRLGYGLGAEVVRGLWSEAIVAVPPRGPKITKTGRLMPVQAMADILAGSGGVLEAEGMLLAVLRDLDHERFRSAAMTLAGAVELLLAELDGRELPGSVANMTDKLEADREVTRELAQRGLAGQITTNDQATMRRMAEEAGALVDAWRYVPLGFG